MDRVRPRKRSDFADRCRPDDKQVPALGELKVYDPMDYGAKGDGETDDSKAFRAIMDLVALRSE